MFTIDLESNPETDIFINDRRSSLEYSWKEHCSSIGKTAIFLTAGAIFVSFLNSDAVAILFFAFVSAIIAMRLNMAWLIFPLVGFYGASINYDGNPLSFTLISMATCLLMAWFMCQWMMSIKKTGRSLKERIESLTFIDYSPDLDKLNDAAKRYCSKVLKLNRQFTHGELELIESNKSEGEIA